MKAQKRTGAKPGGDGAVSKRKGQKSGLTRKAREILDRTRAALGGRHYDHVAIDDDAEIARASAVDDDDAPSPT